MYPVKGGVLGGGVQRPTARGEREQVAGMPRKLRAVAEPRCPTPSHHKEQLARRVGIGDMGVAGTDVDEVGAQAGRGGGPSHAEHYARIER